MSTVDEYWVTDNTQKRFFSNPRFCSSLCDRIREIFSMDIEISLAKQPTKNWHEREIRDYRIRCTETDMQETVFDFIRNYLKKIQSSNFENSKSNDSYH